MKLFPYCQHTLHTSLSQVQVYEQLYSHTLRNQPLSPFLRPLECFCGVVQWDSFRINHTIRGKRNSFSPQICGSIHADDSGTRLNLSLALHPTTERFLKFYLVAVMSFILLGAVGCLAKKEMPLAFFLCPLFMGIFAIVLTHIAFQEGCKDALRFLDQILQ